MIRTLFANSIVNTIATSGNLAAFPPNKTTGCLTSLDFMLVVLVLAVGIGAFTRNPRISGHIGDKRAWWEELVVEETWRDTYTWHTSEYYCPQRSNHARAS